MLEPDMLASAMAPIPPAPWSLHGEALVVMGRLPARMAHALAQQRGLLAPHPIGSMATLAFIRYTATPVGPYHEVAVSPGLLWHAIPAAFISHMPVDSARSCLGGRAIWGLPKTVASFHWDAQPNHLQVALQGVGPTPTLAIRAQARGRWPNLAIPPLPCMSARGPRWQLFTLHGCLSRIRRVRINLEVDSTSAYAPLTCLAHQPHLAWWIESFQLRISSPIDVL